MLDLFGNACKNCGYNSNLAALHFHHLDASKKVFKLGMRTLSNRSWKSILEETNKCQLLCANCHAKQHNPELTLENVIRITHGALDGKPSSGKGLIQGNLNESRRWQS